MGFQAKAIGLGRRGWPHRKRAASRSPVTPPSIQIRWGIWIARSDLTFVRGSPRWFPSPSGVRGLAARRVAPSLAPPRTFRSSSRWGPPFPVFRPGPRRGPSRRLDVPTEPAMKQPPDFNPLCASRRDPVQSLWIAWDSRVNFPEKSALWTCPQVRRDNPYFASASRRSSSSSHSSSAEDRSVRAFSRAVLILSKPARSRA